MCLAQGHEFFSIGGSAVSSGQDLLAYAIDTQGRRIHTTYLKNLASGALLPDVIPNVTENLAWGNDNRTLFYGKQDETTLRQHQIWRHIVGSDPAATAGLSGRRRDLRRLYFQDQVEEDLMLVSAQTISQEYRYLDADKPGGEFKMFLPRARGHEYQVDHIDDRFIIRTNDQAKNFRLMTTPVANRGASTGVNDSPSRRCLSRRFRSVQGLSSAGRAGPRADPDPRRALVGERRALLGVRRTGVPGRSRH